MSQESAEKPHKSELPPARDLWQIPGMALAIVIFLVAAYLVRHPLEAPSDEEADFQALVMAYETGETLRSAASAEAYLARHGGSEHDAVARFVFADSRWELIRTDPSAIMQDLSLCLDGLQRALLAGLPSEYEAKAQRSRGEILLRMDLPSDALQSYTALLGMYPEDKEALLSAGLAHMSTRPPSVEKAKQFVDRYLATEGLSVREIQRGYLAKARIGLAQGEYTAAAEDARRVLEAGPDGETTAEGRLVLSAALLKAGDSRGALEALSAEVEEDVGRFEAVLALRRAVALWKNGRMEEAREALDDTIFAFPGTLESLGARYNMAMLLHEEGKLDAAQNALLGLLRDMSDQETIRTPYFDIDTVAELWFSVGRAILAKQDYEQLRDFHIDALVLMSKGRLLYFDATLYLREAEHEEAKLAGLSVREQEDAKERIRQDYLEAGRIFAKVLESASGDIYKEALYHAGHSFYKAGDYALATQYLLDFAGTDREDKRVAQALYEAAAAYAATGACQSSLELCAKNAREHPKNVYAYRAMLLQGDLYRSMGADSLVYAADTYGAILTDARFLTRSNEWRRALFSLGETLYALGRYEDAALKLEEAAKRFPQDERTVEAQYYLGLSWMHAGLLSAGVREDFLGKAAELFSHLAASGARGDKDMAREAAFLEGDCYYELGDYARALGSYDSAAEAYVDTPEAARALFYIAHCYHHLGQTKEAKATYKRALFNLNRQKDKIKADSEFHRSLAEWRGGEA